MKTERELHYEPSQGGYLMNALLRSRQTEDLVKGLKAFLWLYFDEYEDETDVPQFFWSFLEEVGEHIHLDILDTFTLTEEGEDQ